MSHLPNPAPRPVTVPDFVAAKTQGRKLAVLTAYDYTTARLLDAAGVDCLLVGDSLGMVVQGHSHCLNVTMGQMVYHTQMVARGVRRSLLVADMPFLSYQVSVGQAVRNAGRLIRQGGAQAVKLEGGVRRARTIAAIVNAEIPVMGHIGLTPQSIHRFGGFRIQRNADGLLDDARALADAGAFALVIECVPAEMARQITAALAIPTIGIGAGAGCDGQVLVTPDLLGLFTDIRPKFVKTYADLGTAMSRAASQYCQEVRAGQFPGPEHEFH